MNLAEEFICPVCLILARNLIFSCKFGHLICGFCTQKLVQKSCPVCRSKPLSRNQLAERLASKCFGTTLIFCRYSLLGCKEAAFGLDGVLTHELSCSFKKDGRTIEERNRIVCSCVLCTGVNLGDSPVGEPTLTCRFYFLWADLLSAKKCCCKSRTACQFERTVSCSCFKCSDSDKVYWSDYTPCKHSSPCLGDDKH